MKAVQEYPKSKYLDGKCAVVADAEAEKALSKEWGDTPDHTSESKPKK